MREITTEKSLTPAQHPAKRSKIQQIEPLAGVLYPGETNRAVVACNEYLWMLGKRSLRKLARKYIKEFERSGCQYYPATLSINTLFRWSTDYHWVQRANAFDRRR